VYFEILGPGEHLAASLERARKRLFAGVHPDVVDQLVLGLERPSLALAPVPKARVRRALGPADMLDRDVRHDVLHGPEHLAARAHRRPGLVDPQARHVLERGGGRHRAVSHVPVKRAARVTGPGAVRVLAAAVIVVPVHRRRGRLQRRLRLVRRRRRVRLPVVQLQVVVHGRRVQAAHAVVISAVLVMVVMVMVAVVVVIVGHVPADVQKVPGPRVARMVRRRRRRGRRRRWRRRGLLLPVVHLMIVVLGRGHVVFLDLDAHAVDQRRVVHKRV